MFTEWEEKEEPSYWAYIYLAGDLHTVLTVCRKYCAMVGACVTIESVNYIYTGGAEKGVRVGFINYARFPKEGVEILDRAKALGYLLAEECYQSSFTILTPQTSIFISRRKDK